MFLGNLFLCVEVLERNEVSVCVYVCEEGKEKNFFGWILSDFNDDVLKEDFEDFFVCERKGIFSFDESGEVDGEEFEGRRGFFEDISGFVDDGVVYLDVGYDGVKVVDSVVDDGSVVFEEVDNVVLEESVYEGLKIGFCEKLGIVKIEK